MSIPVDYYFTPQSPWAYLGHARFAQIARAAGAAVRVLPIDLGGKVFPVSGDDASRLIIAVDLHDGVDAAMKISGAVFTACWAQERHIANEKVLAELLAECGLDAARLEQSYSQAVQERYEAHTAQAIEAGVFGAPTYRVDGELFWGQDRLDFVERRLNQG